MTTRKNQQRRLLIEHTAMLQDFKVSAVPNMYPPEIYLTVSLTLVEEVIAVLNLMGVKVKRGRGTGEQVPLAISTEVMGPAAALEVVASIAQVTFIGTQGRSGERYMYSNITSIEYKKKVRQAIKKGYAKRREAACPSA